MSVWLRAARGPKAASRWWDAPIAKESEPDLAGIFRMAQLAAGAGQLKVVYRSNFDAVGKQLAAPDLDLQSGAQEIVIDHVVEKGHPDGKLGGKALQDAGFYIYAWFPDRTPFTLALTRKDVPKKVFAITVRHIDRARLGCHAPVSPGARQFRVGFQFKRNGEPGRYSAEIRCNVGKGNKDIQQVTVAALSIPAEPDAWHEVAANVEVPADSRTLFVYINVERQGPDAQCWLADAFIAEYVKDR